MIAPMSLNRNTTGLRVTPRAIRVMAGYRSLAELSRKTGIARNTASRIEAGDKAITVRSLGRYAKACGVSVAQLLDAMSEATDV